jgi:hypothetical protein
MHNRIKVILACLVLVAASCLVNTAAAAVRHPKLDVVASEFAGRPIAADCYTDSGGDVYDWDITYGLYGIYGLWQSSTPNDVFLSPAACQPLLTAVTAGLKDAGLRPFAVGAVTLVHESFHARTMGATSEADTEACAMKYLPRALEDFGIYSTKTIAVKQVRTRWVRRKVRGRWIRFRSSRVVTVWRENHNALPPSYLNGTCTA